jgi:hypothetical protein
VLVDNDADDPIDGTFASIAEGAMLTTTRGAMAISYRGGSGNDITLRQSNPSYHLSEGATGTFFDTDLLIANPSDTNVPIEVTLLPEGSTPKTLSYTLAPRSRLTIPVDTIDGFESAAFSTIVTALGPHDLVVERTMRWDATGYGAHTEKAVEGPDQHWLFAEGSEGYFRTFLLLANPQDQSNVATVRYLRESGGAIVRAYDLTPRSRQTIAAADDPDLVNQSFGIDVSSDQPVVVERSMYWNANGQVWAAGTNATATRLP